MEQKRVSLKVARALKEAGYPQPPLTLNNCYGVNGNNHTMADLMYHHGFCYYKPTYLEAWDWLWREKGICIEIKDNHYYTLAKVMNQRFHGDNPEEAIINAIDYLADNNLIR